MKMSFLSFVSLSALALSTGSMAVEGREPIPAAVYMPQEGKRVACFITINSTEERAVFTRYLDPRDWDLVELTAPAEDGGKEGWFGNACKRGIQCDINVISGHFAGKFFGSSGYSLALSELENHSCAQDCKGILEHPKEVYLFGCNALASKEGDHRTPEEYYDVLREDGYPHEVATRVVEDRYGALGQDNRAKVQRAFFSVPYIHGFYSTSPLGKDLKPILENYMKRLGNFTKYFDFISKQGASAKTRPNLALNAAMNGHSFTQCSGLDKNDPEYQSHLQICALFDKRIPITERLLSVELMLNNEKVLSLLPSIQNFIRSNIREIKESAGGIFLRLQRNETAKNILIQTMRELKSPIIKIEWMRFSHLMGWISQTDLNETISDLVSATFSTGPFEPDMGTAVCALKEFGMNQMDFSSIIPKIEDFHFSSKDSANAISCIGLVRYPAFRESVNNHFKERTQLSSDDTMILATLFSDSVPTLEPTQVDREILAQLNSLCLTQPLSTSDTLCGRALSRLGAADDLSAPTLATLLNSATPRLQVLYVDILQNVKAGNEVIETAMLDVYLTPNHPYWYELERYFFNRPLRARENQEKMLSYLSGPTPGRRADEMIFALREMVVTPAQIENTFNTVTRKPIALGTSTVLSGYLHLVNTAGGSVPLIEKLLKHFDQAKITNERDLNIFYEALALPKIRLAILTSGIAKQSICSIINATTLPPSSGTEVPLKTCAELTGR